MVETKISDINEEKINSIKAQFQDEIELRDFSTRIVMDKMNYAYQNVLKEEYDKKITIFSTESNQNQMKTTSMLLVKLIFDPVNSRFKMCTYLRKDAS